MRRLIKMLKNWSLKNEITLTKWQRNVLFEFITDEFVRGVNK